MQKSTGLVYRRVFFQSAQNPTYKRPKVNISSGVQKMLHVQRNVSLFPLDIQSSEVRSFDQIITLGSHQWPCPSGVILILLATETVGLCTLPGSHCPSQPMQMWDTAFHISTIRNRPKDTQLIFPKLRNPFVLSGKCSCFTFSFYKIL